MIYLIGFLALVSIAYLFETEWPMKYLIGFLVLVTVGHLAWKMSQEPELQRVEATLLEVGDTVSGFEGFPLSQGCRAFVAFQADCPFCRQAKEREMESGVTPPIWLARDYAPQDEYPGSILDPVAYGALQVMGVPALIVLSPRGIVLQAGPYRGEGYSCTSPGG